ncbi:hypothetical protein RB199_02145 [Streptomyces libani]
MTSSSKEVDQPLHRRLDLLGLGVQLDQRPGRGLEVLMILVRDAQ